MRVNGDPDNRIPGIVSLSLDDVSGESLVHLMDLKGICISSGSACTSGKDEPSHVLLALGLTTQQAKSAVRISYGKYNVAEDVEAIVSTICDAYSKILDSQRRFLD
jgi:cysteine desulfurase